MISFSNACASGQTSGGIPPTGIDVEILTGASGGTIVKSLEIISGNESCNVKIIRKDASNNVYATIPVEMNANDYLVLWEGFFVIPPNHKLIFNANSANARAIANYAEISTGA